MKNYHDVASIDSTGIVGQVRAKQERIARNTAGIRQMVAIGSGKGGVGKSTLTSQLAGALHASGHTVAVLDADLNGPTQARLSGLPPRPFVPGEAGVVLPRNRDGIGVVSMGSLFSESESVEFESVAKGDSYTWRALREFTALGDLLASVGWGELDYLLIDLAPGVERTFQYAEFFGTGTAFVLVSIPSDVAGGVVARSIAALRKTPNRLLGYILNMDGYLCPECQSVKPLFPGVRDVELNIPCLGGLPFDPVLAERCDRGEWIGNEPQRASAQALMRIARNLRRALGDEPTDSQPPDSEPPNSEEAT